MPQLSCQDSLVSVRKYGGNFGKFLSNIFILKQIQLEMLIVISNESDIH